MSKREPEELSVEARARCFVGAMFCAAILALFTYLWVQKSNSPGGIGSGGVGIFFLVSIVWPAIGFVGLMKFALTGKVFKWMEND